MNGRNLLFLAGVNIDISPSPGEHFPLTKFAPWAAYLQRADGTREILEQDELLERLGGASNKNPAQIDLEKAIEAMANKREVEVHLYSPPEPRQFLSAYFKPLIAPRAATRPVSADCAQQMTSAVVLLPLGCHSTPYCFR